MKSIIKVVSAMKKLFILFISTILFLCSCNPNPDEMTMICSVDFETEDFYTDFVATHRPHNEKNIFDGDYNMIWIMW